MAFDDWPMLTLAVTVAIAVAAAAWAYANRSIRRPTLPLPHVAAAGLVGFLGWEIVVYLPGAILGYVALTVGIREAGVEINQALVVTQVIFVVAAALAVVGVLRRRTWGIILALGLSVARLATTGAVVAQTIVLGTNAQVIGDIDYLAVVRTTLALQAVPPIVAIGLLAWPLLRGRAGTEPDLSPPVEAPEWRGGATPADQTH